MVRKRTGMDATEIASQLEALIVTKGGNVFGIYTDGTMYHIPVVYRQNR
jgi:hypothetical protein